MWRVRYKIQEILTLEEEFHGETVKWPPRFMSLSALDLSCTAQSGEADKSHITYSLDVMSSYWYTTLWKNQRKTEINGNKI